MQEAFAFKPDQRMGLIFHLSSIGLFTLAGAASLGYADQASISPVPAIVLIPFLVIAIALVLLAYRIYALQTAQYTLEREGIQLRWGLRTETIPIDKVLWIHPADDLTIALPRPRIYLPGAMLGKRHIPGDGVVEYLASDPKNLLFIATEEGGFAISPSEPASFLLVYHRFTEMGSLEPLAARSVYPAFLLQELWSNVPARTLLICCIVHLGFFVNGSPGDLVPAARLMLLPLLNFFYLLIGILLGLFFFRKRDTQPFSYLLWSSNAITTLLFLLAVYSILQVS
jgi:hypothetical protein